MSSNTKKHVILSGTRYNRLTIIREVERKSNKRMFLCRCDCGNDCVIRLDSIMSGHAHSCGCYNRDVITKHGYFGKRLYNTWAQMKQRCLNPASQNYKNYGGRGIEVCNEWLDFTTFCEWAVNNGYHDNLEIERTNNNGNYEPSNCKWATNREQSNNRRNTKLIAYNGQIKSMSQWATELNISYKTLKSRFWNGWTIEEAFITPIQKRSKVS